jgi:hypothetical protein
VVKSAELEAPHRVDVDIDASNGMGLKDKRD